MAFVRAVSVACLVMVAMLGRQSYAQDGPVNSPVDGPVNGPVIREAGTFAGLLVAHEALENGASVQTAAELFALTQGEALSADEESANNILVDAITRVADANDVEVSSLNLVSSYDPERGILKFNFLLGVAMLKKALITAVTVGKVALAAGAIAAGIAIKDALLNTTTTTIAPGTTDGVSTTAASTTSTV